MGETTDPKRIEVWVAMADHFLDTETRHEIPLTALRCIEADLTVAEARDVWRYEVSRAVGFNAWSIAGEWAGWDRDWLIERIERLRRRWDNAPGTARWLRYRFRVHLLHGVWVAISECMEKLLAFPDPDTRKQASLDLASLARQYFDFSPDDYSKFGNRELARFRALYPQPFRSIFNPAGVTGENLLADRRVRKVLARSTRS